MFVFHRNRKKKILIKSENLINNSNILLNLENKENNESSFITIEKILINPENELNKIEKNLIKKRIELYEKESFKIESKIEIVKKIKTGLYLLIGTGILASTGILGVSAAGIASSGLSFLPGVESLFSFQIPLIILVSNSVIDDYSNSYIKDESILLSILKNTGKLSIKVFLSFYLPGYINHDSITDFLSTSFFLGITTNILNISENKINLEFDKFFYSKEEFEKQNLRLWIANKINSEENYELINEKILKKNNYSFNELNSIGYSMYYTNYDLKKITAMKNINENKNFINKMYQIAITTGLTAILMNLTTRILNKISGGIGDDLTKKLDSFGGEATYGYIVMNYLIRPIFNKYLSMALITGSITFINFIKKFKKKYYLNENQEKIMGDIMQERNKFNITFSYAWNFLWESLLITGQNISYQIINKIFNDIETTSFEYFQQFSINIQDEFTKQIESGTLTPVNAINAIINEKDSDFLMKKLGVNINEKNETIIKLEEKSQSSFFYDFFINTSAFISRHQWNTEVIDKHINNIIELEEQSEQRIKNRLNQNKPINNSDILFKNMEENINEIKNNLNNKNYDDCLNKIPIDKTTINYEEKGIINTIDNLIIKNEFNDILNSSKTYNEILNKIQFLYDNYKNIEMYNLNSLNNPLKTYMNIRDLIIEQQIKEGIIILEKDLNNLKIETENFMIDTMQINESINLYKKNVIDETNLWFKKAKTNEFTNNLSFSTDINFNFSISTIEEAQVNINKIKSSYIIYNQLHAKSLGPDSWKIDNKNLDKRLESDKPKGTNEEIYNYHVKKLKEELIEFNNYMSLSEENENLKNTNIIIPKNIKNLNDFSQAKKASIIGQRISWIIIDTMKSDDSIINGIENEKIAFLCLLFQNPLAYKQIKHNTEISDFIDLTSNNYESFRNLFIENKNLFYKELLASDSTFILKTNNFFNLLKWWGIEHNELETIKINKSISYSFKPDFFKLQKEYIENIEIKKYANPTIMLDLNKELNTQENKINYINQYSLGIKNWIKFFLNQNDAKEYISLLYKIQNNQNNISKNDIYKIDNLISRFQYDSKESILTLSKYNLELYVPYLLGLNLNDNRPSLIQFFGYEIMNINKVPENYSMINIENIVSTFKNYYEHVFGISLPNTSEIINDINVQNQFDLLKPTGEIYKLFQQDGKEILNRSLKEFNSKTSYDTGNPLTSYLSMFTAVIASCDVTKTTTNNMIKILKNFGEENVSDNSSINLSELSWKIIKENILEPIKNDEINENGMISENFKLNNNLTKLFNEILNGNISYLLQPNLFNNELLNITPELYRTIMFGRNEGLVRNLLNKYLHRISYSKMGFSTTLDSDYYKNFNSENFKSISGMNLSEEKYKEIWPNINILNNSLFGNSLNQNDISIFGMDEPYNSFINDQLLEFNKLTIGERILTIYNKTYIIPTISGEKILDFIDKKPITTTLLSSGIGLLMTKYSLKFLLSH